MIIENVSILGSTTKKRKKYFQRQRHANNNEAIPSVLKKILRVLTLKVFCLSNLVEHNLS